MICKSIVVILPHSDVKFCNKCCNVVVTPLLILVWVVKCSWIGVPWGHSTDLLRLSGAHAQSSEVFGIMTSARGPYNLGGSATRACGSGGYTCGSGEEQARQRRRDRICNDDDDGVQMQLVAALLLVHLYVNSGGGASPSPPLRHLRLRRGGRIRLDGGGRTPAADIACDGSGGAWTGSAARGWARWVCPRAFLFFFVFFYLINRGHD
jgi:hypothetical protein